MRTRTPVFILIPLLAVLSASCGGQSHPQVSADEVALREEVLTALDQAEDSDFLQSFERLTAYEFSRNIRTEQYDDEDFMLAYDEYLVRTMGADATRSTQVERTDSAGSFDFGFFNRFVSENVEGVDPVNLIPYVLPDDRGYADPRNQDGYSFRFRPDTLLWDREAHVVEIRARQDAGDGLNVRLVRQFIDVETNRLVGVYLERVDRALLFREESAFYVDLKPVSDGRFLPYNTRFETKIRTPFRGEYKIRTVSTFSSYRPLGSG